eukprot:m.66683 g.66683  ORF g.66683 m.66683 type:complete len:53 (-) comp49899_c0_seq8:909-1067(-)
MRRSLDGCKQGWHSFPTAPLRVFLNSLSEQTVRFCPSCDFLVNSLQEMALFS